jgi:hypothetical protein
MTPITSLCAWHGKQKQDKKQVQHNRNNYNSTAEITKQNSRNKYLEQQKLPGTAMGQQEQQK